MIEHSPMLPHQLQELRDRLGMDMRHHAALAGAWQMAADRARRRARTAWGVFRIYWTWRGHVNESKCRKACRRYIEIRRALKDADEARVGHRHVRRILHRDGGNR